MPGTYKVLANYEQVDGTLPRDTIVNTLWFFDTVSDDPTTWIGEVADVFVGASGWAGTTVRMTCKAYHWTGVGEDMGPPVAEVTKNPTTNVTSVGPREVALCLSYYGTQNKPRTRGRIYLPLGLKTSAASDVINVRPPTGLMGQVVALGQKIADVGNPTLQWVVHSTINGTNTPVTHVWCDNEWDTQRRRGLKGTTRNTVALTGGPG